MKPAPPPEDTMRTRTSCLLTTLVAGCGKGPEALERNIERLLGDCTFADAYFGPDGVTDAGTAQGAYTSDGDLATVDVFNPATGEVDWHYAALYGAPHEVVEVRESAPGYPDRVQRTTWEG